MQPTSQTHADGTERILKLYRSARITVKSDWLCFVSRVFGTCLSLATNVTNYVYDIKSVGNLFNKCFSSLSVCLCVSVSLPCDCFSLRHFMCNSNLYYVMQFSLKELFIRWDYKWWVWRWWAHSVNSGCMRSLICVFVLTIMMSLCMYAWDS